MTITTAATGTPIGKPQAAIRAIDENGMFTSHAMQLLSGWREFLVGINRVIPCNATGTNTITLTPLPSGPVIEKYVDHEIYIAVAAATSTGDLSATVVPRTGALDTLFVYKDDGATRATTGDVVLNSVYMFVYADHLNGGSGGLVLK